MITRLYIDNFRTLVNLEIKFDRMNLFLGANGSGKSAVFDVLRRLQDFIVGDARASSVFPTVDLTRWQTSCIQRFEMELSVGEDRYAYLLVVEHDEDRRKLRTKEERLDFNGRPLFASQEGFAQLYRDDHTSGPKYPFDWTLSGVGALREGIDNKKVAQFKRELSKIVVVRPVPALMQAESHGEEDRLSLRMENFASWYRYLAQEQMAAMSGLFEELRNSLPGFRSLTLSKSGEDARVLKAEFVASKDSKKTVYSFRDLSDGQKMLVALYSLIFGLRDERLILFLDEPDNYLALQEVQPWLTALVDACGETMEQAVLISHHPEIINYLGGSKGRWFDREPEAPTRVTDEAKNPADGLLLSETVARGWVK